MVRIFKNRDASANTFAGPAGKSYAVSLDGFHIEETKSIDGKLVFFPRDQQDAHLRFGFLAADAAQFPMVHGSGFSLDGAFPYNGIVVELAFRTVASANPGTNPAWQASDYRGAWPSIAVERITSP